MNGILIKIELVSRIAAWFSGFLLLLASIMIAVEVVLRKAFSISIGGADELSSYALAISCTWGFSYALIRKSHIRIDVLYTHLSQTGKFALDILANILLLVYVSILSYFAFIVVKTSVLKLSTANTPLATPLWVPQSLWLAGLLWFGFTLLLILIGTIYHISKKDLISATRLSGISTLNEEIQETAILDTTKRDQNIIAGEAQ